VIYHLQESVGKCRSRNPSTSNWFRWIV